MIEALVTGSALGLVAGLLPGPFLSLVTATAMTHGARAGLRVALAPVGVELPIMLVTVFVVAAIPDATLRWIGVGGGAIFVGLGMQVVFREAVADGGHERDEMSAEEAGVENLAKLVGAGLFSPSPWVFWGLVGAPLVIRNWREDPVRAPLLVGAFLAVFVGTQMSAALLAARGASWLDRHWRRRVRVGLGLMLAAGGLLLAWQAWVGNYQELVSVQQRATEFLEQ